MSRGESPPIASARSIESGPWWRSYQREWLSRDLLAGVTVAAYMVPQVMGYAAIAGLPPITGLWASLLPLVVYALLGSSRQLSVGPESTTALMTATVVAPLAAGDPARYAMLAAALAVVVGVACLLAYAARLGFVADLLSRPVLVGYLAGVALTMIVSQLGKVTGVPVTGDSFVGNLASFGRHIGQIQPATVLFAAAVLAVLLVGQYRYVAKGFFWEMPTGGQDAGETRHAAAQRELAEEAGYEAGRLTELCDFHTSKSVLREVAHLFLAEDLRPAARPPDHTEFIERRAFPFREVVAMVERGEIKDAMTIIAVLRAARQRGD